MRKATVERRCSRRRRPAVHRATGWTSRRALAGMLVPLAMARVTAGAG